MFAKSALAAAALIAVFAGSQSANAQPICQTNPGLCAKLPLMPVKPLNPVKFPVIPLLPPKKPILNPVKFPVIPLLPGKKPIITPIKFPVIPVKPLLPLPPAPLPTPAPQPAIDINVSIDGGPAYVPYDPAPGYGAGAHHKHPALTLASVNAGAIGPAVATQQQVATASCYDVQQAVSQAGFTDVALESCGKSDFVYNAKLFGRDYLVDVASTGQLSGVIALPL